MSETPQVLLAHHLKALKASDLPARVRQAGAPVRRRRHRSRALPAASDRARGHRPRTAHRRATDQGGPVKPAVKSLDRFELHSNPLTQQDPGAGAGALRVRQPPRERHRGKQQRHRQDSRRIGTGAGRPSEGLGRWLPHRCGSGQRTARSPRPKTSTASAAPAYRVQAADRRRAGIRALSQTGAGLFFEVFSQRNERGSIIVTSNLSFDESTGVFGSERPQRRAARSLHPPRPHPRDERRQLSTQAQQRSDRRKSTNSRTRIKTQSLDSLLEAR